MGHPIKHFLTITNHRHKVIANCARAGILWQGLRHDLSKYSPTEFIPGAKFFQGDRSPNEKEREIYGSSRAWMHHKGRNRHHYEYWNDYNPKTKQIENVEMPTRFLIEMFCDRVAASRASTECTRTPRRCSTSCSKCCVTRARRRPSPTSGE